MARRLGGLLVCAIVLGGCGGGGGGSSSSEARTRSIVHATELISAGLDRINGCPDDACRAREGRRLAPLLVAQKRVVDDAFGDGTGCVAKTRPLYDEALTEAVKMARAVARLDQTAAQVAAANSVRRFGDGSRATKACAR